jgi:hypothetical protein
MDVQVNGDTVRIILATLLRVIDRLGARALGERPDDLDKLEREVRSTLFAHLADVNAADTAAGVALAHTLVEPILRRLRDRASLQSEPGDIDLAALPVVGQLN